MFLVFYGYLSHVGNCTVAGNLSLEVVVLPVLDIFITNRTVIKMIWPLLPILRLERISLFPVPRGTSNTLILPNSHIYCLLPLFLAQKSASYSISLDIDNHPFGIIRNKTKLKNGLKGILELKMELFSKDNSKKESKFGSDNIKNITKTLEVKSSLIACESVIRGALMRKESRGAHYKTDFPVQNDEIWKVNIYCKKEEDVIVY
jgi:hypothetical protein